MAGIDFSGRSLEHARQVADDKGLHVGYVHEDYLGIDTQNRFDLILMIMCDFCALSPSQRSVLLQKFRSLLVTGGAVLLDVYSLNAFDQREEASLYQADMLDGFWSAEKYYGFLNSFKYEDANVVLDKYTIVEATRTRTRTVYNWLQCFSPEPLGCEFEQAGFVKCDFFGDVAGGPLDESASEFAIIARR